MSALLDDESIAMLADGMARFRDERYTFELRQRWLDGEPGFSRDAWRRYADLGWLALALPEKHGGFGDDPRALATFMEYVGGALALEPVFANVLCARLLARCPDAASEPFEAMASGERAFALAHAESAEDGVAGLVATACRDGRLSGRKTMVLHGDVADRLLVSARDVRSDSLVVCTVDPRAAGVVATRHRLLDGRGAASFEFDSVHAQAIESASADALDAALDDARLALCSEIHGAIRALNAATLDYLKTRRQFGRPIGDNQALQHRMVDLFILQQEVRAVIEAAQRASDRDRVRAISGALAHSAAAARQCAHEAVQMHGGMGMTSELSVSHYFKRLMVAARLLGDREWHLARFAAAQAPQ